MKKIVTLVLIGIIGFVANISFVAAAPSYEFYVNKNSIENGQSVTATVKVASTAAWDVKITSSGNTSGCTNQFADVTSDGKNTTKYFSVTCKGTNIGSIKFTLSGDITSSDGSNISISGTKTVTVTKATPVITYSSNNYLSSLAVEGYEFESAFDKTTNEFHVTVPPITKSVNVVGVLEDSKANLSGIGNIPVSSGLNNIEIIVTAENGSKRTYVIKLTVEEEPIEVYINNNVYSVVKNEEVFPSVNEIYNIDTMLIGEDEIPIYRNMVTDMILVVLKDSNGKVGLYIYENDTYTPYNEYSLNRITLYLYYPKDFIVPEGYVLKTISILDTDVVVYQREEINNGFYLVYGMNVETGEEGFYKYDSKESTFQRYDDYVNTEKEDLYLKVIIGLFGLLIVSYLIWIITLSNRKNKKRNSKMEVLVEETIKEGKNKKVKKEKKPKKEKNPKDKGSEEDRMADL